MCERERQRKLEGEKERDRERRERGAWRDSVEGIVSAVNILKFSNCQGRRSVSVCFSSITSDDNATPSNDFPLHQLKSQVSCAGGCT